MTKAYLIDQCDKLFSEYIRLKFGKCELCLFENSETIQPSHCYSRNNKSVRWDELNVMCLCNDHHRWWESLSTEEKEEALINHLGENIFKELLRKKNETKQWHLPELKQLRDDLIIKINNLKSYV